MLGVLSLTALACGARHLFGGVDCLLWLVHIQNRCRVRRYSESHETSDLRPFTFGHRKRAVANRATLLRGLRHAPSPDHPRQPQRRTRLPDSPLAGLRLPDGARCHPHDFDRRGLDALVAGSSRPKQTHRAFDDEQGEALFALFELLHQEPRKFGKEDTFWTLEYAAEVSFERGITQRQVSGQTIRATLAKLGVRWEQAKRWIENPDPEYARKKGLEIG